MAPLLGGAGQEASLEVPLKSSQAKPQRPAGSVTGSTLPTGSAAESRLTASLHRASALSFTGQALRSAGLASCFERHKSTDPVSIQAPHPALRFHGKAASSGQG
jgi:hypothetical protein